MDTTITMEKVVYGIFLVLGFLLGSFIAIQINNEGRDIGVTIPTYPEWLRDRPEGVELIRQLEKNRIGIFTTEEDFLQEFGRKPGTRYSFNVEFDQRKVDLGSNSLESISISQTSYTGGAHVNYVFYTPNFRNRQEITLGQFLQEIGVTQSAFFSRLNATIESEGTTYEDDYIITSLDKVPNWRIGDLETYDIEVIFPVYSIASFASGNQMFKLKF